MESGGQEERWICNLDLTEKVKRLLLDGGWLNAYLIDAALLRNDFPGIGGLKGVCFSRIGFDYSPFEEVQFHHINGNHWVFSSLIGGKI